MNLKDYEKSKEKNPKSSLNVSKKTLEVVQGGFDHFYSKKSPCKFHP